MALDKVLGIVDVLDFTVQDFQTRELLFDVNYATSVGLSSNAERLDIRGGIGTPIRISADHSKSADFTAELPLVDTDMLGVKLGRKTDTGSVTAPKSETLYVALNAITLEDTPLEGTLKVYTVEANERDKKGELKLVKSPVKTGEYSITDKVITVFTDVADGSAIKVIYDYKTSETARRIRVTATNFPGYVRIFGTGYALDESGNKSKVSFICHKAKPTPDFEINFQGGTATNIPFNCTLSPYRIDGEEAYYDIIPLPDEAY